MSTPYASPSLYVGDLHPEVSETVLFELFKQVGAVASIRVCRDGVTRRSLGYAYVNFHSPIDAEKALESLNYSLIKNKPCRIMWSYRDPSIRKSGVGNVFVKNLDKSIDNKSLYDTFVEYGVILSCKVATDENGASRGYGFIHYERQEEADLAIEKVNELPINGKKVFVAHFIPKKEKLKSGEWTQKFTNVYVKNLDLSVDEEQLHTIFAEYGTITKAAIMRNESGASRGFGFVNFSDPEAARAAAEGVTGKEYQGKTLFATRAQKKGERERELKQKFEQLKIERLNKYQGVNLYIKNLDDTIDDEKLASHFASYGSITSKKVMRDEKGNSRGFGFVCFNTPEEAGKAVLEMNGRMLGTKPIYVALAQRRDVRKAQLEAQYRQAQGGGTAGAGPVFYPPGSNMPPGPRPQNFIYSQQMITRPGWPPGAQGGFQPMPNFVVPVQRPPRQNRRNNPSQSGPGAGTGRSQNRGRNSFKYTTNARNSPQQGAMQPPPQHMGQNEVLSAPGQGALSIPDLAAASPEDSKQMLGESLFPLIAFQEPQLAGKITGMLLESLDVTELIHLMESNEVLTAKIAEAKCVLQESPEVVDENL